MRYTILSKTWIFFDIGSTLVDETEAYNHRIRDMIADTNITFKEFDSKRVQLAKQGFDGNSEAIKFFNLTKTPWHSEDEIPFADTFDTLKYLKSVGYKLGIIANQSIGAAERLNLWGLLHFFNVIVTSAEFGISKPNKLIFEKALKLARCLPQNSIMVGDRLDNDIIPAKFLKMKTVWIRKGLSKYQSLELGKNNADWIIDNLADMKNIFN